MTRGWRLAAACFCLALLAACGTSKQQTSRGGGYYKDDGPGQNVPANIARIPDAVPRIETHRAANMRPYAVFGRRYVPTDGRAFRQTGVASWYGRKFHGNPTATGERYDMYAMTAAHPTLPLPSYARVTRPSNGRSIIVRINDRGPFHSNRIIDLSYAAAAKLGLIGPGSGQVIVEAITHDDIRRDAWRRSDTQIAQAQPAPPPPAPAPTPAPLPAITVALPPAQPLTHFSSPPMPDALSALHDDTPLPTAPVPAPVAVSARTPSPLRPDGVFLQFGAFSLPASAHQLAQRLNATLSAVEHRPAEVRAGASLHRVVVGPYASRTEAVNAAVRIEQALGQQAMITMLD